jgi:hypothetical protein
MLYSKLVGLFIMHFHTSIKFEGKPGTLSLEWCHVVGLTEVDPSLASKYQTRMDASYNDKHPILLHRNISYCCKTCVALASEIGAPL